MFNRLFGTGTPSMLLEAAFNDVTTMLQQAAKMLDLAVSVLLDNEELVEDLDRMDDVIDDGERMVRRTVLEHLSVNPQQDLVASLILVSLVQDAERLGDFARGLADLSKLARQPRTDRFADDLRTLAGQIRPLFETCEQAFRDGDADLAVEVITRYRDLKQQFLGYAERVAESDLTADMALVYGTAALTLRRIGAHLSNIASSVVQPYDRIRHGDEEL